ncbi:hypothetical protein SMC26_04710 [Actinomadura fulvescens]|uniref:Secreted protein n=1 Tax=Actinomadura fulvescens TaxID=46160 RepID=A0ABN3PSE9_9ACTN
MRNVLERTRIVPAVVAFTAAAFGLTATAASAANVAAPIVGRGSLVLQDDTTGAAVSCATSEFEGETPSYPPPPGLLFRITEWTLSDSSTPDGRCVGTFDVGPGNPGPFEVHFYSPPVATGQVRHVTGSLHGSDGCDATFTGPGGTPGTITGNYNDTTSEFQISGGDLVVTSANPYCDPTLIRVGDQIELDGAHVISPKIVIPPSTVGPRS